jgi:hypothetical protein
VGYERRAILGVGALDGAAKEGTMSLRVAVGWEGWYVRSKVDSRRENLRLSWRGVML